MIPEFTMGDRMRKAREITGMSQTEFAEHLGVGRSTVYNCESDGGRPKTIVLRAWALATGVPAEWLLTGKTPHRDLEAAAMAVGLPHLDSNQEPADYRRVRPVSSIADKRRVVGARQRAVTVRAAA